MGSVGCCLLLTMRSSSVCNSKEGMRVLGIPDDWEIVDSSVTHANKEIRVVARFVGKHACPVCGCSCPSYDHRRREWCILDICGYRIFVEADVARVNCPDHGIKSMAVPWDESSSQYTEWFESRVTHIASFATGNGHGLYNTIRDALSELTSLEFKVLCMRLGIGMTLNEVGKQFNMTEERIRQIEAKTIRKLRHPPRSTHLISFTVKD